MWLAIGPIGRTFGNRLSEKPRLLEIANPHEIIGVTHHRLRHIAPSQRIFFNRKQVEKQLMVEIAQRNVADRSQPPGHPFWRVVADSLDVYGSRPRAPPPAPPIPPERGPPRVGRQQSPPPCPPPRRRSIPPPPPTPPPLFL